MQLEEKSKNNSRSFSSNELDFFLKNPQDYLKRSTHKASNISFEDYSSMGNLLHKLIFYKLKGFNIDFLLEKADKELLLHFNNFNSLELAKFKPLKTEWAFRVRLGNDWLIGRMDAIFENRGKYIIADWKTGKISQDSLQAKIYVYAFCKIFKKQAEDVEFWFVQTKTKEVVELKFDNEKLLEIEEFLLATTNRILAER